MVNLPVIHIVKGNMKLGTIPNISLRPVIDCVNCDSCAKACYDRKAFRMYPNVRMARTDNANLWALSPETYEARVSEYLEKRRPTFFRWHVGGDIKSRQYFAMMKRVASKFPAIKFLAFTKAFQFLDVHAPENLSVVLSIFPNMRHPPSKALQKKYRKAFAGECGGKEFEKAVQCPGICETCGLCWELKKVGKDVRFNIH